MNSFYAQLSRGKPVEKIVKEHLQNRGHFVSDVSDNPEYWEKDIDFIIADNALANYSSIDAKRDDNISKTGNFFFELESEDGYGRVARGWGQYCEADYICFFDCRNGKGYIVDWQRIKPILSSLGRVDYFYDKLDQKLRKSKLVPIGTMRKNNFIVYEWEENENGKDY